MEFIPSLFDPCSAYGVNLEPQVVNKEIYEAKEILDSVKNKMKSHFRNVFIQTELSIGTLLKPDNKINQSDSKENNLRIYFRCIK